MGLEPIWEIQATFIILLGVFSRKRKRNHKWRDPKRESSRGVPAPLSPQVTVVFHCIRSFLLHLTFHFSKISLGRCHLILLPKGSSREAAGYYGVLWVAQDTHIYAPHPTRWVNTALSQQIRTWCWRGERGMSPWAYPGCSRHGKFLQRMWDEDGLSTGLFLTKVVALPGNTTGWFGDVDVPKCVVQRKKNRPF